MFDIYVLKEDVVLPKSGNFYVVAANGNFMHKDSGVCKCLVPVEGIGFLEELNTSSFVRVDLPKIPHKLVYDVKKFFEEIEKKQNTECEVNLLYSQSTKEFKIYVPKQIVSHVSVSYTNIGITHLEEFENFQVVGTIHSHSNFGAFHSSVDVDDEKDFDGLHITFGDNDKESFSISASHVVNGYRVAIDPEDCMEGIVASKNHKSFYVLTKPECYNDVDYVPNEEWHERVVKFGEDRKRPVSVIDPGDIVRLKKGAPEEIRSVLGDQKYCVSDKDDNGRIVLQVNQLTCTYPEKYFSVV